MADMTNMNIEEPEGPKSNCLKAFCVKYFLEGQTLQEDAALKKKDPNASWFTRHRRLVSFVVPGLIAHIIWWSIFIRNDLFHLFTDTSGPSETPNWYMSITMIFGSMTAGATSEGGAAVAFPIMTLAFGIAPKVARDFSFMIQSAGMTAAASTIIAMKVQVEKHALFYSTIGGVGGIIFGLELVSPNLDPPFSKMYFVCIWGAFAFSLFWLNRYFGRRVFDEIPMFEEGALFTLPGTDVTLNWKSITLFLFGFLGGIFSAISGRQAPCTMRPRLSLFGIDICTFACLTLLFRVSEKVATPTSVVLMAINTLIGFLYRQYGMGGVEPDAVNFFAVAVPFVVIGAPLGSLLGSHFHRLVLASLVYITDFVQFVGALVIVRPWTTLKTDKPVILTTSSAAILVLGAVFFSLLARWGKNLLDRVEVHEAQKAKAADVADDPEVAVAQPMA
ncbi:unnamed protein product [Discosporangium mesarthrocarpum]